MLRCSDVMTGSQAAMHRCPLATPLMQVGAGADQGQCFSLQAGAGVMSGCNDENIVRHAPLQRNNEGELFCNNPEWVSQASIRDQCENLPANGVAHF